jgi:hypothetical protein
MTAQMVDEDRHHGGDEARERPPPVQPEIGMAEHSLNGKNGRIGDQGIADDLPQGERQEFRNRDQNSNRIEERPPSPEPKRRGPALATGNHEAQRAKQYSQN